VESTSVPEQQYQIRLGAEVITADNKKLGKVRATDDQGLIVEKGRISKTELVIPRRAINSYSPENNGTVYLSATESELHGGTA
jgi:hypothetical protein